jgi:hypothetical protein
MVAILAKLAPGLLAVGPNYTVPIIIAIVVIGLAAAAAVITLKQ